MRRRLGVAAAALAAALIALAASATGVLDRLEGQTQDARFAVRGEERATDVAVVAIDGQSITELNRWPIRRVWHARAIDALREAGVAAVAYDVQFTEPSGREADDYALYEAVARNPGTVLSTTEVDEDGHTNVLGGDENLRAAKARAANTSTPVDIGAVVRRVHPSIDGLETFAVAAAEAATKREVAPFEDALIDYHGGPGTVPTYRFVDLVRGRVDPAKLRGRVVVVGASAPSLQDLHPVPTAHDELMPGPEVQANAISTVLRGLPLRDAPGWLNVLAIVALALVVPVASLRLRARWSILVGFAALGLWLVGAQLAFDGGTVLAVVPPVLALLVGGVGALGAAAILAARDRRRMRFLFGRFVPEPVVDELLAREDATGGIAGVRQESTVLFCDLRGFTTFAESAEPELVIEVLNTYLGEMSDAILGHDGTVVSYLGDGIMAVFGSPVERADHAIRGLAAAEELLAVRLPRLNAWLAERELPPFRLGVGLNSGAVMSGTVGSERRMEYAAVGDTTNVAARLQAATKGTPHALFVSEATWERLDEHSRARLAPAGEQAVAGRGQPVPVYAPRPARRLRAA
ncbi:MAG TPA: adenylate/guanylate cyclase domain-containing protein [Solirubrobacteraceae bacterium]|jgi:adenylate cyclase|nr:adenylate/guanylate cyclase domain-containing protein [Solirubrobacteraceae bacterium]